MALPVMLTPRLILLLSSPQFLKSLFIFASESNRITYVVQNEIITITVICRYGLCCLSSYSCLSVKGGGGGLGGQLVEHMEFFCLLVLFWFWFFGSGSGLLQKGAQLPNGFTDLHKI